MRAMNVDSVQVGLRGPGQQSWCVLNATFPIRTYGTGFAQVFEAALGSLHKCCLILRK